MLDIVFDENKNELFISEILIPPLPIQHSYYYCDKYFHIELISDLYEDHDQNGIIMIRGELTEYYTYKFGTITKINSYAISRQKNHGRGGQSSGRFSRIRENQIDEYVKTIIEKIITYYYDSDNNVTKIKKLIICGIGDIKNQVIKNENFPIQLKNILAKIINISNTNITNLIDDFHNTFDTNNINDLQTIDYIFDTIQNDSQKIIFGNDYIFRALNYNLVKTLIIHIDIKNKLTQELLNIIENNNCEVITITNNTNKCKLFLDQYNGFIGISYIPIDIDILD